MFIEMSSGRKEVALALLILTVGVTSVGGQGIQYVERQLLCALDRAPCDSWGQQVKAALPEIISNQCKACDNVQLNNVRRIVGFVQTRYPDLWTALVDKYS